MPLLCTRNRCPADSAYPALRQEREGWGTRSLVVALMELRRERFIPSWIDEAGGQSEVLRRRNALAITETELKLIAAAAIIGLSSNPITG